MRISDWSSDVCSSDLACRIATQYMTPVMLLTDGYIANAAEPWRVPDLAGYEPFPVEFLTEVPEGGFKPYGRDEKLARPWVNPGTPSLLHRIGGIEKEVATGHLRSEEHTSDIQSLMRISTAAFSLQQNILKTTQNY